MAIPSNAFVTYDAIGNREDLIDMVINISPTTTPMLSRMATTRATSTLHEWQNEELEAPAANAQIEGDTNSASAITATTRVTNRTQILSKDFIVSETQEAVAKAGRTSEVEHQTMNKMKALATDIEFAFVTNSAAASGDSATARQMNGMRGFIITHTSNNSGTARDFAASILDPVLEGIWSDGGNPDIILAGGKQKRQLADTTDFPGVTREINAERNKISNNVQVYESPFGTLEAVLSHVMHANHAGEAIVAQTSLWKSAFLREIKRKEFDAGADGRQFKIVAEVTLECLQEKGNGNVKDLNT